MTDQAILQAIANLGTNAYGLTIWETVMQMTGRRLSLGSLYAALDRLEEQGVIRSWEGGATPERGGRPKRFFRVEPVSTQEILDRR